MGCPATFVSIQKVSQDVPSGSGLPPSHPNCLRCAHSTLQCAWYCAGGGTGGSPGSPAGCKTSHSTGTRARVRCEGYGVWCSCVHVLPDTGDDPKIVAAGISEHF